MRGGSPRAGCPCPEGQVGQWDHVWTHHFNVDLNPCTNTFSGTGDISSPRDPFRSNETVNGSFNRDGTVNLHVTDDTGLSYTITNEKADNQMVTIATMNPELGWPVETKVSPFSITGSTNYKNHGQYVSAIGGGDDAAHSCIRMPINSSK